MKYAVIGFALLLAACASQVAQTPEQKAYALQSDYNGLLEAALTYESLPRCDVAPDPCSDEDVVQAIRDADTVAFNALQGVQQALRGGSETELLDALTILNNALFDFQRILARRVEQ